MARRYLDDVVLLDDATILAGMRFVARALQAAGRAGRRRRDRGGALRTDPDPRRRARRRAAVGRERRYRTARGAAGRCREASRGDRLSGWRPVDPFAPLEPAGRAAQPAAAGPALPIPPAIPSAPDVGPGTLESALPPTPRLPRRSPFPCRTRRRCRRSKSTRRLLGASFDLLARSSPEMRPASFYVGLVILGTVAPLALAAWATIVTDVQRSAVREPGRARPDLRGLGHVPGLDRRRRVPGRAHRLEARRRVAARGAPGRPADHGPPGPRPESGRVLAGGRGDGDRRRRIVPHPGRDRRRARVAGRCRREHRDRRHPDRDRAVRRAVRLPPGGDRARRRAGDHGARALAPGLPCAEDGRGRGGAVRDGRAAPDPVRPRGRPRHRLPDRRRRRAGTGSPGPLGSSSSRWGSSSACSRSGPWSSR